jgi:hypothetical protein
MKFGLLTGQFIGDSSLFNNVVLLLHPKEGDTEAPVAGTIEVSAPSDAHEQ